jgi:hypothetical protein
MQICSGLGWNRQAGQLCIDSRWPDRQDERTIRSCYIGPKFTFTLLHEHKATERRPETSAFGQGGGVTSFPTNALVRGRKFGRVFGQALELLLRP